MRRRRLSIPAPIAERGQIVKALNYRRRPARFESGEVIALSYDVDSGWSYTILLHRQHRLSDGRESIALRLYVGDDAIEVDKDGETRS